MPRKTLTGQLHWAARGSATGRSIRTAKAGRRGKNTAVGRTLGKAGVWHRMWR